MSDSLQIIPSKNIVRGEQIGEPGGFGTVYLVHDRTLGEDIAIKTIPAFNKGSAVVASLGVEYRAQRQVKDTRHVLRIDRPLACTHSGMEWVLLTMEVAEKSFRDWLNETSEEVEERREEGLEL